MLEVNFKLILCMILKVIYKYLNSVVNETTYTGHTSNINYNTNYKIVLIMILFSSSWCEPLKTNSSREISAYIASVKPPLRNTHPDKLMYVCYCSTWKCLILTGTSFWNAREYML